ncbi:Uncharacterised protein [Streptococcus pneumoniae]|nr:Uncharacterised protein [Streptococcus pneumoniae]
MNYQDKYWELARQQAEYIDSLIIMKLKVLESELIGVNQSMTVRLHEGFLRRLHNFNRGECNARTLEKFLSDINEIGYYISQDYPPDYSKTEYTENGITTAIDPTKIKLTVTYKVISI